MYMIRIFYLQLVFIFTLTSNIAYGSSKYLSNGFSISDRTFVFDKITKQGKCEGAVIYPNIYGGEQDEVDQINQTIKDFAENYDFCKIEKMKLTSYELKEGSNSYFSVRWITKDSKQTPLMINSLNFNKEDGKLLFIEDILSPLAKNFMPEFVKLSENHLATDITWDQFLNRLEQGYIQFYISNSKWYIVFNPLKSVNKSIVERELPNYLLKSES